MLDEVPAAIVDEVRAASGCVTVGRKFYLDHFRAHFRQHQGAGRACHDVGEVENFVAVQYVPRSFSSHLIPSKCTECASALSLNGM
jgi:hypothetical protein